MDQNWIECRHQLPREGQVVETKIDDARGTRNIQKLVFESNLWWFPDRSMYVYYSPTHWRPVNP